MASRPSVRERLNRRTDRSAGPDGCWLYSGTGGKSRSGHRQISVGGRDKLAHRVAWELHHQREIPAGLVVRHSCDVPNCVNPAHLLLGTVGDNNRDMEERGRRTPRRGERSNFATLTEAQVLQIRRRLAQGAYQRVIAAEFGVSQFAIWAISNGRTWAHLGAA